MTVKTLKYAGNWREEILSCGRCGWRGTFEKGRTVYYDALIECNCPKCDAGVLAMLVFPSRQPATEVCSGLLKAEVFTPDQPGSNALGFRLSLK